MIGAYGLPNPFPASAGMIRYQSAPSANGGAPPMRQTFPQIERACPGPATNLIGLSAASGRYLRLAKALIAGETGGKDC
jgi:hypothetical protein